MEVQVYPLQNSDRRHFHEKGYTRLQHDEWLHYQLQAFQTAASISAAAA